MLTVYVGWDSKEPEAFDECDIDKQGALQ